MYWFDEHEQAFSTDKKIVVIGMSALLIIQPKTFKVEIHILTGKLPISIF